jgi:CheY-like chemotaxis protein
LPHFFNRLILKGKDMCHVLIIDDEESISRMLCHALTKYGYVVETATGGQEGIEKFDQGSVDLVITDVVMPGIDGNLVARHIRNSPGKPTPIIGLSGTPWFLKNGDFDAVLSKPFSIKPLIDTVKCLTTAS